MKPLASIGIALLSLLVPFEMADAQDGTLDPISQQATKLEAELGKFKDSSPEAAEVMAKLVDLYHENGRVLGLIRIAQTFTAAHPGDPRHQEAMRKLMDGLEIMSRNKDLIIACRQFQERYPDSKHKREVQVRLARTLVETTDQEAAAEANHEVWRQQGPNAVGRRHGLIAQRIYLENLRGRFTAVGAELTEQMFDRLPKNELARDLAMKSFEAWRQAGEPAKSNVVAQKLLKANLLKDKEQIRSLHYRVAENQSSLGQHRNAYASYTRARSIRDDSEVHYRQMRELSNSQAAPNELEPLVNDYVRKYPNEANRYHGKHMLAAAFQRAKNNGRALALYREMLTLDAPYGRNAEEFISLNGNEPPAKVAETERILLDAIKKNSKDAAYLRYALAFYVYRDRMKNEDKTREVLRDLVVKSPDNSNYTSSAISWLFSSAKDDAMFAQEVDRVIRSRRANLHIDRLRKYPGDWASSYRKHKDLRTRARALEQKLAAANKDPVMSLYIQHARDSRRKGVAARTELLRKHFDSLPEEAARQISYWQAHYYRHYAGSKQRAESASVWSRHLRRFSKDQDAAASYLVSATDYSPAEVRKEAALKFLTFPPQRYNADLARRLFIAADSNKDGQLAKRALQWVETARAAEAKINSSAAAIDPSYSSFFGDILAKYDMKAEAARVWRSHADKYPEHWESRECASRLLNQLADDEKPAFMKQMLQRKSPFFGRYATWLAEHQFKTKDYDGFARTLADAWKRRNENPLLGWDFDGWSANNWLSQIRQDQEADDVLRGKVYRAVAGIDLKPSSAIAKLLLLDLEDAKRQSPIERLLTVQAATRNVGDQYWGWDPLAPFAQAALAKKDFVQSATLATGMLANIPSVDANRKERIRKIVSASYARMGAVGLTIDESSPLAPLLQAALYLRLGDRRLAFEMYQANKPLFDQHRNELPVDLVSFICETLSASGGDENFDYVEDVLRTWLVKNSESMQVDEMDKAKIQLLLAKNYFRAKRFDIARSEFTTVINRYPDTQQALDAEFGVGETFMEQKVFDQAERVFEKLAQHADTRTMVRADFLRGVLAFRRGDSDEARDIFRAVLERVPDVELANQTLYNLAEVYRVEERYIDQLNLLRTVGRLGQRSKRRHAPGVALSIVVHDSDLGISRGHNKIPVLVSTEPGGDRELVYLSSAGAGKGLFRFDLETQLGVAKQDDNVLQVLGGDVVRCDYPKEFKAEFRNVPLSDVEISMAANAEFAVASSRVEDEEEQSFSEQLRRENEDQPEDERVSQIRPANQIKPGNPVYLQIKDSDRDLTDNPDTVVVKVSTDSGDEVQIHAEETGAHTGVFEASLATAELPAGALASDSAIDHSPLMAIDKDPATYWQSQPDGATPKHLTVDMKGLFPVSRARVATPNVENGAPVRSELQGSYDGEFWFRLASHPPVPKVANVADQFAAMTQRVYRGNYTSYRNWRDVVNLARNNRPLSEAEVQTLSWTLDDSEEENKPSRAVLWFGKFVQPEDGAVRIAVTGANCAIVVDGVLELPLGAKQRTIDVWLAKGAHELTVFTATTNAAQGLRATRARADVDSSEVRLTAFHKDDFDLESPAASFVAPVNVAAPVAELTAVEAKLNKETEQFGLTKDKTALTYWQSNDDIAEWNFDCKEAGVFEVVVDYAHPGNGGGFDLQLGGQTLQGSIANTGDWARFQTMSIGYVLIETPGPQTLSIKPTSITSGGLMNLKGLTLRPASEAAVVDLAGEREFRFPTKELRYVRFVANEYLGESVAVNHLEIGNAATGKDYIPTEADILSLADNDILEIAAGDTVTATYTDEFTQTLSGASQLLTRDLTATYNNAAVNAIAYDYDVAQSGVTSTSRKDLMRVDPGEEIVVEIVDYDQDTSSERDVVEFEVILNGGEAIKLTATETDTNTGVFTRKVFTDAKEQTVGAPDEKATLKVAEGDVVGLRYFDQQNTFPGHAVPRRTEVFVNRPTDAVVRILASTVTPPPAGSEARPRFGYATHDDASTPSPVAFAAPFTVEVFDPDAAKDSRSRVVVQVKTTDGALLDVECIVSDSFWAAEPQDIENAALREGRFVGQALMQLGGKSSPVVTPLTPDMPRGLIGRAKEHVDADDEEAEPDALTDNLVVHVLNVTGKDLIEATYLDKRRAEGKPESLVAGAKLVSQGLLQATDREYEKDIEQLHVGEKLFLLVQDPDQDLTDERDLVEVQITTKNGEKESVKLAETTVHSGVFTGSFLLKAVDSPTPGNAKGDEPIIESYFGDDVRAEYSDPASPVDGDEAAFVSLPVVVGTDGLVSAFSKTFNDEELAVETKFRIAESYFELFKSHRDLSRKEEEKTDLEAGRRILNEVMEDYPDPKYAPRVAYLLGQFAQELEQWDEAIRSYELIIQQHPDHTLAPDAQYKLAQCHEESGDFDEALEAYVTLAATHPKSPLIASVMIRISDYFYKNENFDVAAQVGEKFLEKFDGHQHAAKIAFRVGQCYYKAESYPRAGESFDRFAKLFPDDKLGADALFWSGESYRLGRNNREAFRRYNRCRWDFPASEAAKYARGRLALPEMLQQFEAEANSIDQDN